MSAEKEAVVFWHHRMPADEAQALARQHYRAFSASACRQCAGVCCKDCGAEVGYLRHTWAAPREIRRLMAAYGYTKADGFRGPTGCRLPLHLRSPTCAVFYCGTHGDGFPGVPTPAPHLPAAQRRAVAREVHKLKRMFEAG